MNDTCAPLFPKAASGPGRAQRSGSAVERTSNRMSELSAFAGSERYGVCEDEVSLSSISVCTEMEPRSAKAVTSTESLSVKHTAVVHPQSA
jgi:hypothetical protein